MQRARKWAPTILHNVFTWCHLHTLCNNGDVAQNHKERLLRLVGKTGLLRPRVLQSVGIPRVYLAKLVEQGELLKTGWGLYVHANSPLTENHSLAEAAKRVPKVDVSTAIVMDILVWQSISAQMFTPRTPGGVESRSSSNGNRHK
jgi:hypothetical protein